MRKNPLFLLLSLLYVMSCSEQNPPATPLADLDLTTDEIQLADASGLGSTTFTLESSVNWSIRLSDTDIESKSVPSWVEVSPMRGDPGKVEVTVTITQKNPTADYRSAYIVISAGEQTKSIEVKQAPLPLGAFVMTQDLFELSDQKDTIDVSLKSNIDFEQVIKGDWIILIPETKGMIQYDLRYAISENTTVEAREGMIVYKDKNTSLSDTVTIRQSALMADGLLTADLLELDGKKDTIDIKLKSRYGVVFNFNVTGGIYSDDGWLRLVSKTESKDQYEFRYAIAENTSEYVREARLSFNNENGSALGIVDLKQATIPHNNREVLMKIYNALGGDSWTHKTNWGSDKPLSEWHGVEADFIGRVRSLLLTGNNLSGQIPAAIGELTALEDLSLAFNNLSGTIPDEIGNLVLLESLSLGMNNIEGSIPASISRLTNLKGLSLRDNRLSGEIPPEVTQMNQWENVWTLSDILLQQDSYGLTYNLYESTDFSANETHKLLHKHTKGKGVQLVIMGDGYSDRKISSGEYDRIMIQAMDAFFAVEPLKSLKPYFDVHCLYLVSKNEVMGFETALGTTYEPGTLWIQVGDSDRIMNQIKTKIPECGIGSTSAVHALVMARMNSSTAVIDGLDGDYSIGYVGSFPFTSNSAQGIQHEVGGHAYGSLHDEYTMLPGSPPPLVIESNIEMYNTGKHNSNVDFTTDRTKVRWHKFLEDERYAAENLGIYEGALYETGIYRSSEGSIMRGGDKFNAPSRQAIYERVLGLAGITTYTYESFVEFDAPARAKY